MKPLATLGQAVVEELHYPHMSWNTPSGRCSTSATSDRRPTIVAGIVGRCCKSRLPARAGAGEGLWSYSRPARGKAIGSRRKGLANGQDLRLGLLEFHLPDGRDGCHLVSVSFSLYHGPESKALVTRSGM